MRYLTASLCRPGGRDHNEDAWGHEGGTAESPGCWVVADGLGGHRGGALAAQLAVASVLDAFRSDPTLSPQALEAQLQAAHCTIRQRQKADHSVANMGSTVVVLMMDGLFALWGHVGDSRLYLFQGGRLRFQTEDHSVPQMLVKAGELTPDGIRHHEDRNRLLRVLGGSDRLQPTIGEVPHRLRSGDAFLLCTDGFWESVWETEMEVDFAKSADPAHWLARLETRLLGRARVGHDNYTAIGVFVA